jgi:hypothetical protein
MFPADFFADKVRALPDYRLYDPRDNDGAPADAAVATQGVLRLTPAGLTALDPVVAQFWRALGAALESAAFMAPVVNLIRPHLSQRLEGQDRLSVTASTLLCDFEEGYELGPHTDSPHKLATLIFCLGPRGAAASLGTALFGPRDPAFRCAGGPHYPAADFERIEIAPFLPNSMFGFVKTNDSFHGVERLEGFGVSRDTLTYTLALA